jgi:hypothetical protein
LLKNNNLWISMSALPTQAFDLLYNHCTGNNDDNKRTLVRKFNEILEGSVLRQRSSLDAWTMTWDKPLYSNQLADGATDVRQRVQDTWFKTPDQSDLPTDHTVLKGLRDPGLKLRSITELAGIWDKFYAAHQAAVSASLDILEKRPAEAVPLIRELIGLPGYSRHDGSKLFHILKDGVHGIAEITAMHILMDLGYPTCKPDLWLVRFVQAQNAMEGELEKRKVTTPVPVRRAKEMECVETNAAVDIILEGYPIGEQPRQVVNLDRAFVRGRFCDLALAKFGMSPESSFGIVRSGMDALLNDSDIADTYPDLLPIAREMKRRMSEN